MSYQFHVQTDPHMIDEFVTSSDQNILFQCSPWAKIKSNWNHYFTSVSDGEHIVATALVLERKLPLGITLFYIPRGPIMDYHNRELVTFYLFELKKLARKHHAMTLRFDPGVLLRKYAYKKRNEENEIQNLDVIELLKSLGAKHRGFTINIEESTQPRFNAQMHVTHDYRLQLEHKTDKCIRAALHKGIELYEGREYLQDFATAMHYTEMRKQVALRTQEYFENMMDVYGENAICMVAKINFPRQIKKLEESIQGIQEHLNQGDLKKKEKNALQQTLLNDQKELEKIKEDYQREGVDEVITSGILAVYNERLMELFYMGNHPDYLRMYSSYLLYSKCLDRCVELGIEECSFGGIEGTLDDGLTLFKSNWLMDVAEYIGEFNIVLNPLIYSVFDRLYPFLLQTVAKMRGRKG